MVTIIMALMILQGGDPSMQREFEMPYRDSTITMKKYVMCIYSKGASRNQSEEEAAELQKAHLAHQDSLAEEGLLLIAGPFEGDHDKRGILIFDMGSVEEVEPHVKNDPMVQAGRLTYELLPWWTMKGAELR